MCTWTLSELNTELNYQLSEYILTDVKWVNPSQDNEELTVPGR